jgi:hypothetical protein
VALHVRLAGQDKEMFSVIGIKRIGNNDNQQEGYLEKVFHARPHPEDRLR